MSNCTFSEVYDLVFTCMPGENLLKVIQVLLCLCDVFQVLVNPLFVVSTFCSCMWVCMCLHIYVSLCLHAHVCG